jgi:hypothetical protein
MLISTSEYAHAQKSPMLASQPISLSSAASLRGRVTSGGVSISPVMLGIRVSCLLHFFDLSFSLSARSCSWVIAFSTNSLLVQAIQIQVNKGEKRQTLYKLFAAYLQTVPLSELIGGVERARRDAQLRYVVIHGAVCSYCLSRAERLDGSYLRAFAVELKEQLAQTLASFVMSILTGPHRRSTSESAEGPPLRQIIAVLQQVMCKHDAEKLAIAVLEIYHSNVSIFLATS